MATSQKSLKVSFVDYVPAELKESSEWRIVYQVKNPYTNRLVRKRIRVKPIKSISQRRKFAKQIIEKLNYRLLNGWNPFFEAKGSKEFVTFEDATRIYLKQLSIEVRDKNLSEDTFKTYKSKINNIQAYIEMMEINNMYCYMFDADFIEQYLAYLRYDKGVSSRTRDNYMTFITTLSGWMIQKKYIKSNPCEGLKKIHKKANDKSAISVTTREVIFDYYKETNLSFLVFCLCCYYCLARRTELSKIKVKDVNLKNNTLWISAEDSKNNRSAHVTIPPSFIKTLANHINYAKPTDYLFSDDNYSPGPVRFKPNKATSNWSRMRNATGIGKTIKWYHLKDSGITDLIIAGVPLNSVRDQARHHSISQTNDYIPKNMKKADSHIKNSGVAF